MTMADQALMRALMQASIDAALLEDFGSGQAAGDHSSLAAVPANLRGKARLLVKQEGVLAGMEVASAVFNALDPDLHMEALLHDGDRISPGQEAFYVSGQSRSILGAERLALNYMQRMSGIATLTRLYVDAISHTACRILDTRKTTPGLRWMEKWAVRIGGGNNHRMGLFDMIMIKDNHVDFCGGIAQAIDTVERYQKSKDLNLPLEIETRNLRELDQVLQRGGVQRIMLDNFSLEQLREAVQRIDGRFESEASGGVQLDTVVPIAETGVNYISVGALTHSALSLDLSLKAMPL